MRTVTAKEVEAVWQLDGPGRFKRFVKAVADSERAWGLWEEGWALLENDDRRMALALWPEREFAEACRVGDWQAYVAKEISLRELLDDLLPRLGEQGVLVGVFPTPAGSGVTPDPDFVADALREELDEVRVEGP